MYLELLVQLELWATVRATATPRTFARATATPGTFVRATATPRTIARATATVTAGALSYMLPVELQLELEP